ncbi:hypothetical protein [Roseovarius dicentrarchi]|uniref:hypothetical protein n=1 Tax=Roseovarius dicentrarchi TaxID=2250573 RepID=UPI000DEAE65B|nr:hypothetical protein [Roseovarius dicentrarchi]
MSLLRKCDAALMVLIGLALIAAVVIATVSPEYFSLVFAAEDRLVENGTALFLLVASVVLAVNAVSLWRRGRHGAALLTALYALMFFMAAGEEISWGQRIFGWESREFFKQNNKQYETNLHNINVGGVQLTKTLFGPVLTICILLYLVGLPLIYPRGGRIAALADRMAVPVPWLKHAVIALVATVIIALLTVDRKWEVYELIFSLLMVSIFLLPQNRDKTT